MVFGGIIRLQSLFIEKNTQEYLACVLFSTWGNPHQFFGVMSYARSVVFRSTSTQKLKRTVEFDSETNPSSFYFT